LQYSFAQSPVDRGVLNLAGSISFSSTSGDDYDDNRNILAISPQAYIFIINNFALGGNLHYWRWSEGDWAMNIFEAGPGIKYYLPAGNIQPFVSSSFLYSITSYKDNGDNRIKTDISLGGGIDVFISKNVAIEPYIRYHILSNKYSNDDSEKSKMFEIGIGLATFIF